MAPEVMSKGSYYPAFADIFSLGIVLFVTVTKRAPFSEEVNTSSAFKLLKDNKHKRFWKIHQKSRKEEGLEPLSKEFQDLVSSLLNNNPLHRPSLSEIKHHPWYKGEIPTENEITEEFERREQLFKTQSLETPKPLSLGSPVPSTSTMSSENSGSECSSPSERS